MREQPLNGDMNWIVPGRILALAGPTDEVYPIQEFIQYARQHNIQAVVRLNRIHYAASELIDNGIAHHDIFFNDGNTPTIEQMERFIEIVDKHWDAGEPVAVHCRAGLGRTGTMIVAFLVKKLGLDVRETIAYLRMMRPGSVLGRQPTFLEGYHRAPLSQLPC